MAVNVPFIRDFVFITTVNPVFIELADVLVNIAIFFQTLGFRKSFQHLFIIIIIIIIIIIY